MLTLVESNWRFLKLVNQRVIKLRGDAQQIFVNGEFSASSSGFWDYTIYVNPYMVVRPEGHYTKHIYVNSERIASKIGNPEDYAEGDPTGSGSAMGRKIKMEEVVEENFNELFGNVPEIEQAAEQELGMSSGSPEPEQNSYWFTSDHLGSSAFVTDKSGVAIQHLEYMAFGEVFVDQRRTGFGTPYKFNAKELDCSSATWSVRTLARLNPDWSAAERRDESGYYYYSARYYDPRMARFLSAVSPRACHGIDPLAGDMPAWGSYTYTFNNPIRLVDPTGMRAEDPPDAGDDKNKVRYVANSFKELPNAFLYAGEQLADQLGIEGPKPGLEDGIILGVGITVFGQNKGKGDHSVPEADGGSNVIVDIDELHLSWAGANAQKHLPNFVYVMDKVADAAVNVKKASKNLPDLSFIAHKTEPGTETTVYNLNDSTALKKTVITVRPQNDSRGSQASMKLDTFKIE